MRHSSKSKHFNRDANQRKLLVRALVTAVVKEGQITTTMTKAKELKRIADKLIHKAQTDSVASRRSLHRFFGKRDVVNTLVDKVAPLMADRTSGFTRIEAVGVRRGDNAEMVRVSLVKMPEKLGTLKSSKTATKGKSKAKVTRATKAKSKSARQPDTLIQQQARQDERQTGVKEEQRVVRRQAKTMRSK